MTDQPHKISDPYVGQFGTTHPLGWADDELPAAVVAARNAQIVAAARGATGRPYFVHDETAALTARLDDDPIIDPDCRDGKCGSCVGGPCQHHCHTDATTAALRAGAVAEPAGTVALCSLPAYPYKICAVDWAALGLIEQSCLLDTRPVSTVLVRQECPCGHVTQSPACRTCADLLLQLVPGKPWHCAPCRHAGIASHLCNAVPVVVERDQ